MIERAGIPRVTVRKVKRDTLAWVRQGNALLGIHGGWTWVSDADGQRIRALSAPIR